MLLFDAEGFLSAELLIKCQIQCQPTMKLLSVIEFVFKSRARATQKSCQPVKTASDNKQSLLKRAGMKPAYGLKTGSS
jgi:hypothetical protein